MYIANMPAKGTPTTPIGATIRQLREAARLNGTNLGEISGLGQKRVSELELGQTEVRLADIEALEQALGLPRGGLLIQAGWMKLPDDTASLLRADPRLSPGWRRIALGTYETAVRASIDEGWQGPAVPPARKRKTA